MKSVAKGLGYPKKSSIKDGNSRTTRRSKLANNRNRVHEEVRIRERGHCAICVWNAGSDYHHVYGRSVDPSDWKESSDAGMWVCRDCHPHGHLHAKGDDPTLESILEECIAGTRIPKWMRTYD